MGRFSPSTEGVFHVQPRVKPWVDGSYHPQKGLKARLTLGTSLLERRLRLSQSHQ